MFEEPQVDPSTYRIINFADGSALDVSGRNTKNDTPVVAWKYHGAVNQLWKATLRDGGVILSSVLQEPNCNRVLEEDFSKQVVRHSDDQKALTQKWYFEDADTKLRTFVIRNVCSGRCLENHGHGKVVTTSGTEKLTPWHVWKVERI